ncbi:MAG: TetR/AcrR family transcriptional regulator [Acetobacteraceae bacterium]|nr:TetR/AcrR family transcriptional regulator [Acetobacteraceae bacterium]
MNKAATVLKQEAEAVLPPHLRLVAVAREMFCRDGIHATGIDRILSASGVSKMTLYTRFGSKEMLVREVLRQEGADWRTSFFAAVLRASPEPQERLRRVIVALEPWFRGDRFYGCAFMNAVAEHSKGETWLRKLALEHQAEVIGFLTERAVEAGFDEPGVLARQIMLVIDGAIAAYLVSGNAAVLSVSGRTLAAILAQATRRDDG